MATLAGFDATTQARATAVLNMFTAQYRISPNILKPEEIGRAVQGALDAAGGADARFGEELWGFLLSYVHQRMAESAAEGRDFPSDLPPRELALLKKGLIARFGPLPNAPAPEEERDEEPAAPAVDNRSPGEIMAELLKARSASGAPIDPEVRGALRD